MATHSIPCPRCHGTGQKTLSKPYAQTLKAIGKLENPTSVELRKELGNVSHTALNQRLKRMAGMGLIVLSPGRPMRVECV